MNEKINRIAVEMVQLQEAGKYDELSNKIKELDTKILREIIADQEINSKNNVHSAQVIKKIEAVLEIRREADAIQQSKNKCFRDWIKILLAVIAVVVAIVVGYF